MRCLKRYIAREVFPHLLAAAPRAAPSQTRLGRPGKSSASGGRDLPKPCVKGSEIAACGPARSVDVAQHGGGWVIASGNARGVSVSCTAAAACG